MKTGRPYHTILYRVLSLLLVLTMLSGHMVPLSYATDGTSEGQGLFAPEGDMQQVVGHPADETATEEPRSLLSANTVMPVTLAEQPAVEPQTFAAPQTESKTGQPADNVAVSGAHSTLTCTFPEHVHTENLCYKPVLICGMEENEIHEHGEGCTQEVKTLSCTLVEIPAHVHTEACNGQIEKLICGQEEITAHTHSAENGCFTPKTTVICGKKEIAPHTHTDACKGTEKKLTCSLKEEEAHTHTAECKGTESKLTCKLKETEGHTHTNACKGEPQLTCTLPEDETHAHGAECYTEAAYTCGKSEEPAHAHGESCYTVAEVNVCGKQEEAAHAHGDGCYTVTEINSCGKQETAGHTHGETCYTTNEIYTCGLEETAGHSHAPECYKTENELTCKQKETAGHAHTDGCKIFETGLICKQEATEGHAHGDACYAKTVNTLCTLVTGVPHVHTESCYAAQKALICTLTEHTHSDSCYAAWKVQDLVSRYVTVSGSLPQGVTLKVSSVSIPNLKDLKQMALDILQGKLTALFTYDISLQLNGEPYHLEEGVDVSVAISLPSWVDAAILERITDYMTLHHVHDDGTVEEISFDIVGSDVVFTVDSFSVFIGTIKSATSVYLTSGVGYSFWQSGARITGKELEWKSGVAALTVKPDEGYQLNMVTVYDTETDRESQRATVTRNETNGTYSIAWKDGEGMGDLLIEVEASKVMATGSVIYFDLSAGNVKITGNSYTGYRFDGQSDPQQVNGTLGAGQSYYVYQSNGDKQTGYLSGSTEITLPSYTSGVVYAGTAWSEYIEDNTNVEGVITAWNNAEKYGRKSTPYWIDVKGAVDATLVIDNLWSTNHTKGQGRTDGGIAFSPSGTTSALTVYAKGDNRFGNIFYLSSSTQYSLCLDGDEDATLTVADLDTTSSKNYWDAAIGSNDNSNHAVGIVINGGNIYAGTTASDDCTAIGGGGNGYGVVTINGGIVTAVCESSGAAIGGGIGKTSTGGKADVTINGGVVYAYNKSCTSLKPAGGNYSNTGRLYIPAAAIGGGSSAQQKCDPCTVTITGGEVYAQTVGGTAIGGGSSTDNSGGDATVIITGGTVRAKSISGTIAGEKVPAGAAIGGGTGGTNGNGGSATLTITGGKVETGSIGGGKTINTSGKIGHANVTIDGGETYGQIIMAGGSNAKCTFTMTGGELYQPQADKGYIQLEQNGAAVWMDDPKGIATMSGGIISGCTAEDGGAIFMTAGTFSLSGNGQISGNSATGNGGAVFMGGGTMKVSGGSIENNVSANGGGAVYMTAGTFEMSGTGAITNNIAADDGGAVYMGGGTMDASGGIIKGNSAANDGGAVYMGGGLMNVSGSAITGNSAANDGGAVYMGGGELNISGNAKISSNTAVQNGGGAYVNDGNIYMSGGEVANNTAQNGAGGGMYVSADQQAVEVKIFSGKVISNSAAAGGGAVAVYGAESTEGQKVTVQTGVENEHQFANGVLQSFAHGKVKGDGGAQYTHGYCPEISSNTAGTKGGAIHIKGNNMTTNLNIYCMTENVANNVADGGDELSTFLMVDGGRVLISTADEENTSVNNPTDNVEGASRIIGTVHVSGGQVDLYGAMTNPKLGESISVDITKQGDYFEDHRYNDKYYKLQYFENFVDPATKQPTGRYTAYAVEKGSTAIIKYAMYHHPGYELVQWNTAENGSGDRYMPTDEVLFDENRGDLTLFGIWEAYVYWISYEPNTKSYGGQDMDDQQMEFNVEKTLQKNTYTRDGYRFTGWNTNKDGSGTTYTDGQSVLNLTLIKDETITLWAQWVECDHDPSKCSFTYTLNRNKDTLIRTCECNGLEMRVSLAAPKNAVYTWENGAAKVQPATKNGPRVTKGTPHINDDWDPQVYYAREEAEDDWDLMTGSNHAPIVPSQAGRYAAIVSNDGHRVNENSVAAYVYYDIAKAEQPAPEVDGVEIIGEGNEQRIQVKGSVADSAVKNQGGSDIKTQYQVYFYRADGAEAGEINETGIFEPEIGYTNYYVEVWYSEGENYKMSNRTVTYPVFYVGKAKIEFDVDDGIGYTPTNTEAGTFKIDVYALEGYYLTTDFKVGDDHTDVNVVEEAVRKTYSISGVPDEVGLVITVTISGVAHKAGVITFVAEKREYGDVLDADVTVSRDSAFTAAYEIIDYDPAVYSGLKLTMSSLPKDSTLLMMDKSGEKTTYWHYKADGGETIVDGKIEVPLVKFVRMGTDDLAFTEPTAVGSLSYQFIVDFSWTEAGCGGSSVDMKLTADREAEDTVTPDFADLYEMPEIKLAEAESFALRQVQTQQEMKQTLKLTYVPSEGAASRWDDRAAALVLTYVPQLKEEETSSLTLPTDVELQCYFRFADETNGNYIARYYSLSSNGDKQYFILPLFSMSPDEEFPGFVDLFLKSDTFPVDAANYSFKAEWIYSRSANADSPLEGDRVAEAEIVFEKAKTFVPAVTVSTRNNQRLYAPGDTLKLIIESRIDEEFADVTSFKVDLLFKAEDGTYTTTAWEKYVDGNSTVDVTLNTELRPGSYCVRTSVIYANKTALQVPYYFVIQKTDGTTPDTGGNTPTEDGDDAGTNG